MANARRLLQLFQDEKAYVHMVGSSFGDNQHRKFIIDQFKNLGTDHRRPFKTLNSDIERKKELNPTTGKYETRTVSEAKDRGKGKPQKATIKAKCCTLAPQDGQINYYAAGNAVALVFNADYCDQTTINKHVYRENAFSNSRHRLYSEHRTREQSDFLMRIQLVSDSKSTATDKLKEYNRNNRRNGIIANHTENESVKPTREALATGGIFASRDDLVTRLNALDFKQYVEDELKLDLPIAIGGPHITLRDYNLADQCDDVLTGLISSHSIACQFATKIWQTGKINKAHIDALSDESAGRLVLNLMQKEKWDITKQIIETRASLHMQSHPETLNTALHIAIEKNQLNIARLLCQKGANMTVKNKNNQSPLSIAILNKNYAMIEVLINHSIANDSPNANDQISFAIFALIRAEKYALAEIMLDRYAGRKLEELNQKIDGPSGRSALHYAVSHRPALARKLVKVGADICFNDNKNHNPLSAASPEMIIDWLYEHDRLSTAQIEKAVIKLIDASQSLLLDQFIDQSSKAFPPNKAGSLLEVLIHKKQFKLAEKLLNLRPDQPVDECHRAETYPIHIAVENKQLILIKLLCEKGANIVMKNANKQCALAIAALNNDIDLVNEMLRYSKPIENTTENNDQLAYTLFLLIRNKHYATAEHLLDSYQYRIAAIQKKDTMDNSTLHFAVRGLPNTASLILKLIEGGAKISEYNNQYTSPLNLVFYAKKYALVVEMLILRSQDLIPSELSAIIKNLLHDAQHKVIYRFISEALNKLTDAQAGLVLHALVSEREFDLALHFLQTKAASNKQLEVKNVDQGQGVLSDEKSGEIVDKLLEEKRYDLLAIYLRQRTFISSNTQQPRRLFTLIQAGENDLASLLASYHSPFNYYDPTSKITTLHLAVQANLPEVVRLLCSNDANVFMQDNNNKTPLALAIECHNIEMVKILLKSSAIHFQKENKDFENAELKKAAEFLTTAEQPLDLTFLLNFRGDQVDKRRVAVTVLTACFAAAQKIEDVLILLDNLATLKPDYLHNRLRNGGVSLRRHQWFGFETSNLWTDIMAMGKARLLELGRQDIDKSLQTKVELHLQEKTSGWSIASRPSTALKLFRQLKENANDPVVYEKLKQYARSL